MQGFFDEFQKARKWLVTGVAYLSFRFYGSEIDWTTVVNGSTSAEVHVNRDLAEAKDLPQLLECAKECVAAAESRRSTIVDKSKLLLTFSSILLVFVGTLLPKALGFDSWGARGALFVAIMALFNVITLLLTFFSVGAEMHTSLDQADVLLNEGDLTRSRINSFLYIQRTTDNRSDYLVELYKVARFFFSIAFFIVVVLFGVNFFSDTPKDQAERIVREIRSDPALVALLRGPQGKAGDKGEKGTVDESGIVRKVLMDPRFNTPPPQARP